jgi:small-conductance mechanosensitive channel
MTALQKFLSLTYFHNSVQQYVVALGILVVGLLLIKIFKRYLLRKLSNWVSKSETRVDDIVINDVERFGLPALSFLIFYWSLNSLDLSLKIERIVDVGIGIIAAFFVIRLISSTLQVVVSSYVRKQENGEEKVKQIGGLMIIINILIWIIGSIFLFDNLGYDVSAVLTGVGIGGIAVALAAQNIIGDLFNYFVIFFDKPFEVGDAINVDDKNGTIEYVGVKTTRLRSLSGEQIIIANSDLTKSRVHNFKRQDNRRIEFSINVTYQTSTEKLRKIPGLIKGIIETIPNTRFDRAHFAKFSEYGLSIIVVYYVTIPDYLRYMDNQQEINLRIMEAFAAEKIDFQIREDKYFAIDQASDEPQAQHTTKPVD